MRRLSLTLIAFLLTACTNAPLSPAALDTKNDTCASCRMPVSNPRLAVQVIAPHEVPLFFDDLGCLRAWLEAHPTQPKGSTAFVADHATKEWVRLSLAVLSRVKLLETPMGSHLVAHSSEASRVNDPAAAGGEPVAAATLLGPILGAEVPK